MSRSATHVLEFTRIPVSHGLCFGPEDLPADVISKMRYLRPIYEIRQKWDYNTLVRSSHSFTHAALLFLLTKLDVYSGNRDCDKVFQPFIRRFCHDSYIQTSWDEPYHLPPQCGCRIWPTCSYLHPGRPQNPVLGR
jgi:hypothetical protein